MIMYNYGILSTARIVKRFCDGIRQSKNGFVYGIASRTIQQAQQTAQQLGIEHYWRSYEELLEDENIDVVYIPTTNDTHYQYALSALQHHKHVILEKPFTLDYQQACHLFEVAKENNCFLMEDQKALLLPVTYKVKQLIEENTIGNIQFVDISMSHPGRHPKGNWMYDISKGGGALNGSGAYPIEYLYYLTGTSEYNSNGYFIQGEETADNLAHISISNDRLLATIVVSMNVVLPNRAIFYGSDGYIEIPDFWKADHFFLTNNGETKRFDFPYESEFVYPVNHVNECIEKGLLQSPIVNQQITCQCVKTIQQLYQQYNKK